MKDLQGVERTACTAGGCDCDEYSLPDATTTECAYCGHEATDHKASASAGLNMDPMLSTINDPTIVAPDPSNPIQPAPPAPAPAPAPPVPSGPPVLVQAVDELICPICRLKPRYDNPQEGHVMPFCSGGCAGIYVTQKPNPPPQGPPLPDMCPVCGAQPRFVDPRFGLMREFCSQSCASKAPALGIRGEVSVLLTCNMGCGKRMLHNFVWLSSNSFQVPYVDPQGTTHPYCSRECAVRASELKIPAPPALPRGGIPPTPTNCALPGCKRRVFAVC